MNTKQRESEMAARRPSKVAAASLAARRRPTKEAVIVYIRTSPGDGGDEEAQKNEINEWAKSEGVAVAEWHSDEGMTKDTLFEHRLGLLRAIAAVRARKASHLVVSSRDRIGDVVSGALVEQLARRSGATVLSADGDDGNSDPLFAQLTTAFAQFDHALFGTRMRATWQIKKQRGERLGAIPWGFKAGANGRKLEPNEAEQRVVTMVRQMRSEGHTIQQIVQMLKKSGVRGRSGKPIGSTRVFEMIHGGRKKSPTSPPSPPRAKERPQVRG
jgi:DNA invertase Pin-like site-specific DNA recombinase